ncbi:S8 family serine peptidase [Rhodococcoides fascians]|uniref:S8 family serine peptidase n=1 Tax=Rhodococcoides fascians TaxID=1828 RepID=UPI002689D122
MIGEDGFDRDGHGTSMASVGLFGAPRCINSLQTPTSSSSITVWNPSESCRDQRNPEPNRSHTAISLHRLSPRRKSRPKRPRVFCLPVTDMSDTPDKPGQPTLYWSATLDALIAGVDVVRDDDRIPLLSAPDPAASRLVVVSAGNVDEYQLDHLKYSDDAPVEDPAQAWNVLTAVRTPRSTAHLPAGGDDLRVEFHAQSIAWAVVGLPVVHGIGLYLSRDG